MTGIEIVAPAVEDARFNARQNGLSERAEFLQGDAAVLYPRLSRSRGFDAVIVAWPDVALTDDERRRIYTAASRALHALALLAGGATLKALGPIEVPLETPISSH